ncbi:protein kinase [Aureococcus anophagefferens]|nr:protein kinase [Aureococcus anophagefferens]
MRAARGLLLATIIATTTAVERVANVILVGGNLTLGSRSISLAQYDVAAREWSDAYEPQLYVYGETGKDAAVYGMAANRSGSPDRRAPEEAIVVGQFDSISETSQSQYCSVGRWTGMRNPGKALARVGDGGLCSRASDPATRIFATTLGRREELFVGGAFSSRVWDGAHFVKVEHRPGLQPFPGGGLARSDGAGPGVAHSLAVDAAAGVLYVGGLFDALGPLPCDSLGAFPWKDDEASRTWTCLHDAAHGFATSKAPLQLLYDGAALFVAGYPAEGGAWWAQHAATAAIARFGPDAGYDPPAKRPRGDDDERDPKAKHGRGPSARRRAAARRPAPAPRRPANNNNARPPGRRPGSGSRAGAAPTARCSPSRRASGASRGPSSSAATSAARRSSPGAATTRWALHHGLRGRRAPGRHGDGRDIALRPAAAAARGDAARAEAPPSSALLSGTCLLVLAVAAFLGRSCKLSAYGYGSRKPPGISLQTLSYGFAPDLDFEFSDAYERDGAAPSRKRARHLANRHALVMIDPSEIVLRDVIGEGSFGRVWSASWQSSEVAVKEFVLAQAAFAGGAMHRRDIIEEIVGEAGIMAYLRHPKILQLYGCSLTAQAIWIVSELCSHGSLRSVLDDASLELGLETRLRMAIDVAEGMLYLHTRDHPIVHRDLKSHNLFVAEVRGRMHVRIGDWGSARAVAMSPDFSRTMTHGVGTTCWLAASSRTPRAASASTPTPSIVLWELATREEVYGDLSAAQIISRVANEGLRPEPPQNCPWGDLMEACWAEDPVDRPGFDVIFSELNRIHEELTGDVLESAPWTCRRAATRAAREPEPSRVRRGPRAAARASLRAQRWHPQPPGESGLLAAFRSLSGGQRPPARHSYGADAHA